MYQSLSRVGRTPIHKNIPEWLSEPKYDERIPAVGVQEGLIVRQPGKRVKVQEGRAVEEAPYKGVTATMERGMHLHKGGEHGIDKMTY